MSFSKLPLVIWKKLLSATHNSRLNIVALDGTGLSRPLPSPYYYRRIDKPYPTEIPLKLSIAVDTRTKKILSLRLRAKRAHDIKDAKYLISHLKSKPVKIVADKGYDAEWLHQFSEHKNELIKFSIDGSPLFYDGELVKGEPLPKVRDSRIYSFGTNAVVLITEEFKFFLVDSTLATILEAFQLGASKESLIAYLCEKEGDRESALATLSNAATLLQNMGFFESGAED